MSTIVLPYLEVKSRLESVLKQHFDSEQATKLAHIFVDAELDGVTTHGVKRFQRFINEIELGHISTTNSPSPVKSFAGWEMWNGNAAPGPLNALHCTNRAVELAQRHGLSCIGLRNTNHWLRPGFYAKTAAKQGCGFIAWSNTIPNMQAHGASKSTLSNTPITIGIPATSEDEEPVFVDLAMSQFSYGKIQAYAENDEPLPYEGGYTQDNQLTSDPKTVLAQQSASAIGYWKGSALAMILDLLAVFVGGGKSVYEIGTLPGEQDVSQAFIAIALTQLWTKDEYSSRLKELTQQLLATDQGVHIPASKLAQTRANNMTHGISVPKQMWQQISQL